MGFSNQDTSSIHRLLPSWLNVPAHTVTCHTPKKKKKHERERHPMRTAVCRVCAVEWVDCPVIHRFRESMDWNEVYL